MGTMANGLWYPYSSSFWGYTLAHYTCDNFIPTISQNKVLGCNKLIASGAIVLTYQWDNNLGRDHCSVSPTRYNLHVIYRCSRVFRFYKYYRKCFPTPQ